MLDGQIFRIAITVIPSCDVAKITSMPNLIIRSTMVFAIWIEMGAYRLKKAAIWISKSQLSINWNNHNINIIVSVSTGNLHQCRQQILHTHIRASYEKIRDKIPVDMQPLVVSPRACTWKPWSPGLRPDTFPVTVVGPVTWTKETIAKESVRIVFSNDIQYNVIVWWKWKLPSPSCVK